MDTDATAWARDLNPEEKLLWTGRPTRRPIILRPVEALLIPFSVLWAIFAVPVVLPSLSGDLPILFPIVGLIFLGGAVHFTVGRFLIDWYIRNTTSYALTSERALIRTCAFGCRTKALPITPSLAVEAKDRARGSVRLGRHLNVTWLRWAFALWHGGGAGFEFREIEKPQAVAALVRDVKAGAA